VEPLGQDIVERRRRRKRTVKLIDRRASSQTRA
jgi:hypothetical protein